MTRTACWFLVAMLTSSVGLGSQPTTEDEDGHTIRPLFNFSQADASAAWRSVNDGVMGGVSEGSFRISEEGVLRFFGTLSLENNGGFASIRSVPGQMNLGPDDVIVLRVRGDGREYLLNLYVPTTRIAYSYRAPMPTVAGKWIDVRVPIQAFVANSFGRPVPGAGPVDPKRVTSIGITLSDKKSGSFTLEVASIGVESARLKEPSTRTFTYTETEHGPLEMVIHFPSGWEPTDHRPAIVFFFGGGWTNGSIAQFEPQAEYLAQRGIVAARADYRVKSRQEVTPKDCVDDAFAAVRWLTDHANELGIDPDRLISSGGSAGGHLAACTALSPAVEGAPEPSRPAALVLFNPVLRFDGQPQLMERIGNDDAIGRRISPTLHLDSTSPPTLLFYGNEDRLIDQGREFLDRATEVGVLASLFLAEGQGHGFFNRPPWRDRTTARMDAFLTELGYLEAKQ
ncbi:CIA30 family protein [Tautonia marina]|uniref:CIA30 family protein n=1 Tax=Tautonia marina TaxID=2653855 RepID=UPI001260AA5E|nr:CIA30 family protein [Tautonia marina]